jgi:hypothetical protein
MNINKGPLSAGLTAPGGRQAATQKIRIFYRITSREGKISLKIYTSFCRAQAVVSVSGGGVGSFVSGGGGTGVGVGWARKVF